MAKTARKPPSQRTRLIKLVHIAKKTLQVSEENYRLILSSVTGKDSCSDMSEAELEKALNRFRELGFVTTPKTPQGKLSPKTRDKDPALKDQKDLVRALWVHGAHHGVIRNKFESGLNAFVRRQTGVDALDWVSDPKDFTRLITALKAMLAKAGVDWEPRPVRLDPGPND